MSVNRIFRIARLLGDQSSLSGSGDVFSWANVKGRAGRRVGGRALSRMFTLNVWGLVLWGEFLNEFRNQIHLYNAREVWLGTVISYAAGYEYGFRVTSGERRRRPYFWRGVIDATVARQLGSRMNFTPLSLSRSGLYSGGRFLADARAIRKGLGGIGMRGVRRSTGAQASRLFWGTLRNPQFNVLHAIAEDARFRIIKNIEAQGLVESGALKASIAIGSTFAEMAQNSQRQVLKAFKGRVPNARHLFGAFALPGTSASGPKQMKKIHFVPVGRR